LKVILVGQVLIRARTITSKIAHFLASHAIRARNSIKKHHNMFLSNLSLTQTTIRDAQFSLTYSRMYQYWNRSIYCHCIERRVIAQISQWPSSLGSQLESSNSLPSCSDAVNQRTYRPPYENLSTEWNRSSWVTNSAQATLECWRAWGEADNIIDSTHPTAATTIGLALMQDHRAYLAGSPFVALRR
jgi:hypothetical protein